MIKMLSKSSSVLLRRSVFASSAYRSFGTQGVSSLKGKDILGQAQFDKPTVDQLLDVAKTLKKIVSEKNETNDLAGKYLATVFYEPSTRTSSSFQFAMMRLGGKVLGVNAATSSVVKGETLADTVRVMHNYVDAIVLRHPESGAAATAAKWSDVPVINAGDGSNEHPTQALLDLFCINEELGKLSGLTVTLLGDLKFGRTVHSLVPIMSRMGMKFNLISPPELRMPEENIAELKKLGAEINVSSDLNKVLSSTDVLYVTRVQKERFATEEEYNKVKGSYVIDAKLLYGAPKHMLVMHPLPRVDEISPDIDSDKRAVYFKQTHYGMLMRMAILLSVIGGK